MFSTIKVPLRRHHLATAISGYTHNYKKKSSLDKVNSIFGLLTCHFDPGHAADATPPTAKSEHGEPWSAAVTRQVNLGSGRPMTDT